MTERSICTGLMAGLLLAAAGVCHVAAQTPPSPAPPTLMPYTDASFGFELQIPAGWAYDRTRFQQFKDSIGLLRGSAPGGRRALQIMVFRSFDERPFEDWVVDFGKALADLTHSTRVDWETVQIPPRAGAVLTYAGKVGADATSSHCLCVPFDPHTVWVLVYSGATLTPADEKAVRSEFNAIVATLKVLYDPQEAQRLAPALDRGKALCERLRDHAADVKLDESESAYDITVGGKSIGYLTRHTTREEYVFSRSNAKRRFAKDGVRVRERSWRFADDGTVRYSRLDLFTSFDMRSELIEFQQTQIPAPDVQPQQPLVKTDQVVREDDVLFSSFTTSLDRALPDPGKPISVGPVYLDLAWVRLLPNLLVDKPAEPYAFVIYNTDTRALLAHRITPLGQRDAPGIAEPTYVFEVRDGFIDQPGTLYADAHGTMVRFESGDLVLQRMPRDEIERRYGPRRDAARKRFNLPED